MFGCQDPGGLDERQEALGLVKQGWSPLVWKCGGVLVLPDVPVQCPPVLFREEGLGQWRREIGWAFVDGLKLTDVLGRWQGGAWG